MRRREGKEGGKKAKKKEIASAGCLECDRILLEISSLLPFLKPGITLWRCLYSHIPGSSLTPQSQVRVAFLRNKKRGCTLHIRTQHDPVALQVDVRSIKMIIPLRRWRKSRTYEEQLQILCEFIDPEHLLWAASTRSALRFVNKGDRDSKPTDLLVVQGGGGTQQHRLGIFEMKKK